MYSYRCYFLFNNSPKSQLDLYVRNVSYAGDGIHAFTSGFWINNDYMFTRSSDVKYWIPPSQILYIEKTGKESD